MFFPSTMHTHMLHVSCTVCALPVNDPPLYGSFEYTAKAQIGTKPQQATYC